MKNVKTLTALLFCLTAAVLISSLFNISPLVTTPVILLGSLIPMPSGASLMAVQKEIWTQDIVGNLYKDNAFASRAFNEDVYIIGGKVVHIPVAGGASAVRKNRTTFPAVAVERTDADIFYGLDTYTTDPAQVQNIDKYELSYDKRASVLGEDQSAIIQAAMEGLLYRWGGSNVVPTLGGATAATVAGGTGNRKLFTKAAFSTIKLLFDKASIPSAGRVALLTADHHQQLLDSFSDVEKTGFYRSADVTKGVIGEYLGIEVMMRATVQRYRKVSAVWTVVDEQDPAFPASDQTADSAASLFYHQGSVSRALGSVIMFDRENDPTYYGDVYSFLLRMGGRIRRSVGVYSVVEDATS